MIVIDITDKFSEFTKKYVENISNEYIANVDFSKFKDTTDITFEKYTGEEYLKSCMKNQFKYINGEMTNKVNLKSHNNMGVIVKELSDIFPDHSIVQSGDFLYSKENGFMSWHTNADTPYLRVYITYSETGDSFFRYYDHTTDTIITSKDNKGVTVRLFNITNPDGTFLWHCVGAQCYRASYGFRVVAKYV